MNRPLKNTWSIILAAGSGSRLGEAAGGVRKQYLEFKGAPLFWHSARTFSRVAGVKGVVFVFPPEDVIPMEKQLRQFFKAEELGLRWKVCAGGERRQDSVRHGVAELPRDCDGVLVHDSARPFVSARLVRELIDCLDQGAQAATPGLSITDTIKRVADGVVTETLVRAELRSVQTPQIFETALLMQAHEQAVQEGWDVTDDASMVERIAEVIVIPGEQGNIKITTPQDLAKLEEPRVTVPCVGWGYDVHRFGGEHDRPLVIGGVPIAGPYHILAHSDGDVLLHALADAILGTFGGGDIGTHFPDTDEKFSGADSSLLLKEVLAMADEAGARLVHADLTLIAQVPRMAPHSAQIAKNLCRVLGLERHQVNFKATTEEKLGFTGQKKGIKAVATVTALREV
ncbi:2-C-methyl-D-erythritol 4-phosphate cytidylyltransferase [Pseudodesulfovibrio piezophilus]|uniref:Bifunctional enzyme IspD/IspF n=1 Tax=Pseudodesulfovibrio piezophilus (strain DSM 21447 / JCM 15486 / C1TLV30) TaxID=1322246 RepID=M1WWC5_PSEP2|nr:2-C-methyl-D-erythritol 4-phosphate cytidylyltransferase [Pseudodesulfovibrio piezophilus]CCH49063.1 Bifunctional enzyme ispD/ispF [Includes: 2-C-methyl-D-erythritol 4-phosphate cytidylyltransferase; 2-C-methyl-D-erythritol 2,4-cyclodiphosphate synthase] [Pseudodesulfovibrio piezophilus C1TLV30]